MRKQLMAVEDIDREEAILLGFAHLCLFVSNLKNLAGQRGAQRADTKTLLFRKV